MNISESTKKRIIKLCETRGITINKLATMCGITQSTIQDIVYGKVKSPTVSTIKKICDALDMSISDFFDDDLFRNLEPDDD